MLSIATYRGDAAEAAAFSLTCWRASYEQRAYYPLWDEAHLAWQLFDVPDPQRIGRLGAYRDGRLVGFFAAEETIFRTPDGPRRGTMSSWLSVAPDEGGRGVGAAIRAAMWDWQRERGCDFMIGFVDTGTVRGKGRGFWTNQIPDASIHRRPLLWTHVLRPAAAASSEVSRTNAMGIRVLALIQRPARAATDFVVRDYDARDFPAARAIFDRLQTADFGYLWDDARLAHQLGRGAVARTLILDRGNGAEALFNVSNLTLIGRQPLRCAVVDFIGALETAEPLLPAFLRACLDRLRAEGTTDAALTLGPPVHDGTMLRRGGFLPLPPAQALIHLPVAPGARFSATGRLLVHWR